MRQGKDGFYHLETKDCDLLHKAMMDGVEPVLGFDAGKWADEFMRVWDGKMDLIQRSDMLGWFSNALMRGYDEAKSEDR